MGRYYYEEATAFNDKGFFLVDKFDGCRYIKNDVKCVIELSNELKNFFKELLYLRFLFEYDANCEKNLYLIWDNAKNGNVSKNILKSSKRFFDLLKYCKEVKVGE